MKYKQTDFNAFYYKQETPSTAQGSWKRTPKNAVDAVAWKLTVLETKKTTCKILHFRSHVIELPTTTSKSEPFFPPFVPETDRRRRPHPPLPEPTRQPTTEEPTRQPTSEDTTNNEELIFVSTVEVNEIMDVATESEKLLRSQLQKEWLIKLEKWPQNWMKVQL